MRRDNTLDELKLDDLLLVNSNTGLLHVEAIFDDLAISKNRLLLYEKHQEFIIVSDKLTANMYASTVVGLSQFKYQQLYRFLRLVMEGIYQVKKCSKEGHEIAVRIEKYIEENA